MTGVHDAVGVVPAFFALGDMDRAMMPMAPGRLSHPIVGYGSLAQVKTGSRSPQWMRTTVRPVAVVERAESFHVFPHAG